MDGKTHRLSGLQGSFGGDALVWLTQAGVILVVICFLCF